MKKIIFLMGALYVVFLISFKEPKEKQKSFSEIIKDDPSRIKELLDVANSLTQKDKVHATSSIDPQDVIDNKDGELDVFRKMTKISTGENWPLIILPAQDMLDIIGVPKGVTSIDTLIFFLGTYKPPTDYKPGHDHSKKRIDRYNARKPKGQKVWGISDLDGHPTFIIGWKQKPKTAPWGPESLFDAATMCPPPDDGSCGYPFH